MVVPLIHAYISSSKGGDQVFDTPLEGTFYSAFEPPKVAAQNRAGWEGSVTRMPSKGSQGWKVFNKSNF